MRDIFEDIILDWLDLKFTLKFTTDTFLPEYPGFAIRGVIGVGLRKISCVLDRKECKNCELRYNCPFTEIFYPIIPENSPIMKRYITGIVPFVIRFDKVKRKYMPGEKFDFVVRIFGEKTKFIPYLIMAIKKMEKIGLGKGRKKGYGRFFLEKVEVENQLIYEGKDISIPEFNKLKGSDIKIDSSIDNIKLRFKTPLRIKSNGHYTDRPSFKTIVNSILRRIRGLYWIVYNKKIDFPISSISKETSLAELYYNNVEWKDYSRYSTRQNSKMNIGGIIGEIEITKLSENIYKILSFAELIHIGKFASSGFGRIEILK